MCCFASLLFFGGPRIALAFWFFVGRHSWDNAWGDASTLFKVLGFIFAPWTILMFLLLGGEPLQGWDWLFLGIGILADLSSWFNFYARRTRDQMPAQLQSYVPSELR